MVRMGLFSWLNKCVGLVALHCDLLSDEGNWKDFLSPGGFFHSSIIQHNYITRFVPFLPLSRRHVERCVRSQLCQRGSCGRSDVVDAVGGDMIYTPVEGHYFSSTGCKAVPAKINLFLWGEKAAAGWYLRTERENSLLGESVKQSLFPSVSPSQRSEQHLWSRQGFRVEDDSSLRGLELTTTLIQSSFVLSELSFSEDIAAGAVGTKLVRVGTGEFSTSCQKSCYALPQIQLCLLFMNSEVGTLRFYILAAVGCHQWRRSIKSI